MKHFPDTEGDQRGGKEIPDRYVRPPTTPVNQSDACNCSFICVPSVIPIISNGGPEGNGVTCSGPTIDPNGYDEYCCSYPGGGCSSSSSGG